MRLENGHHAARINGSAVTIPNPNYLQAGLLWRQLQTAGVSHIVISPGSRSTPLARTAAQSGNFECHVLTDERVAAFFALGLAKGLNKPVAVLCTSGTAPAHYFPAVIEASLSGYPLVVVTADRPQNLRNQGAPQTIDQPGMFGKYSRMTIDLPLPVADSAAMKSSLYWIRQTLAAMLSAPAGPVHINVPMDEPLAPLESGAEMCAQIFEVLEQSVESIHAAPAPSLPVDRKVISDMEASWCGLIVCGPDSARTENERRGILSLARKLGWPMLCDIASGLRFEGEPGMPGYDIFLRHEQLASIAPDFVFQFGGHPTSKVLCNYLNRHKPHTVRMQRDTIPRDPDGLAARLIVADIAEYCRDIVAHAKVSRDSLLLDPFWKTSGLVRAHMHDACNDDSAEVSFVLSAIDCLPDDSNLVLASSMPVRYADLIAVPSGRKVHVFAQRGTNGIDGVISHAAGIAHTTKRPTLLICGDLAFLHDLGGWMAARHAANLRVLLLNNNGGGIFHFLPVADFPDTFETLHGTPLNVRLDAAAEVFGIKWMACASCSQLADALSWHSPQPSIIEVKTDRAANRAAHERIVKRVLSGIG
ncbi:2-succinyl-5-enolpyruvyl-6-hydroxy-3-cyclohexene-1-carboxylic-acid synthase [bacterium]|nr:2-succinyl-5-enolpyruvyl-6-hydroxy-3-cyclohexene-1-carboxylic-acid synthase [bacterium]